MVTFPNLTTLQGTWYCMSLLLAPVHLHHYQTLLLLTWSRRYSWSEASCGTVILQGSTRGGRFNQNLGKVMSYCCCCVLLLLLGHNLSVNF
jgi:hypothetical protein